MRGDSLRDLYAKTLAVIGLGVLAGAGALVDYWPIGISYPTVASTFSPPPLLPASLAVGPTRRAGVRRGTLASFVGDQTSEPFVPALMTLSVNQPALPLGEPVDLTDPIAPLPEPIAIVARAEGPERPEWLNVESDLDAAGSPAFSDAPAAAAPVSDESADGAGGRGFVTGALSKTTTSLVRTGRWTGASIVSAVRVVRGVVGRAIPD